MSDEVENLKKLLEETQALLEDASTVLEPLDAERHELDAEEQKAYQAYQAAVAKARARKAEIDNAAFEARTKVNRAKQEAERLRREIEAAEKRAKLEQERLDRELEMLVLQEKWDRLTMGAPWREFAKDHQIKGAHKIVEDRNVIVADPMGLGKTLTSIIACDMVRAATKFASPENPFLGDEIEQYEGEHIRHKDTGEHKYMWDFDLELQASIKAGDNDFWEYVPAGMKKKIVNSVTRPSGNRILYICPSSLIRNVMKEFRLWAPHRTVTFVGGMPKASRQFAFGLLAEQKEFVVICNYEAWRKDLSLIDSFIDLDFDTVIIDEAHNVKEMKTSSYRGVQRIIQELQPPYVIPMTGTPILNRPQELFSLLTLVNPRDFHTLNDFLFDYCEQDDDKFWKFKPGGLDRIAKRIGKNFMRRTRDQAGIVLPEKTIINHDLEVDKEAYPLQAKARKQMAQYATIMMDESKADKAITATAVIAMFTRLRQIETWPAGIVMKDEYGNVKFHLEVEESQKVDYVISKEPDAAGDYSGLIPEAIADERMVLFSQFKAPLREIKERVERAGYRAVIMDGDTPAQLREEVANDFDRRYTPDRSKARWDIVLCNYRVGGVGLNLTAATQMVILDEEWNPGKRDQAYDRLHRIGQEEAVTIHVIRNQGSIDDWLAGIMENKEGLVEGFNSKMVDVEGFKDFLDKGGLA